MSTYDLEEQEQLAEFKAWWKQYGGLITAALAIVCMIFAAWTGWTWYQRTQAANAAANYEQLQKAARANDVKSVRDAAGAILEQYPRTIYAPLAALVSAKVHFQSGDLKTARAQLQWAVENSRSAAVKSVALLRLASVLIDDNAAADAAKILEASPAEGFEGLLAAMRGDALWVQNKLPEARMAYKAALEQSAKLDPAMRDLLQLKLDALGAS